MTNAVDKNKLMTKQHDLMQSRADCLEKAGKAFDSGDKETYKRAMEQVTQYNTELEDVTNLLEQANKNWSVEMTGAQFDTFKGDHQRVAHTGQTVVDKIRGTEQYANAWLKSIRLHTAPEIDRLDADMAPLAEAENAVKAMTLGGGSTPGEDGGFLAPLDFDNQVIALAKEYVDLSKLVNVEHVQANSGWRVVETAGTRTKLPKVEEMGNLAKDKQPKFSKIKYDIEKYGERLVVSNELMSDAPGLIRYLAGWWAPKYILTINDLILTQLNAVEFAALDGTKDAEMVKALKTMLNAGLNTAHSKQATLLTNALGYDIMDGWADTTGRPLLVQDVTRADVIRFKGRPVVYADVGEIPDETHTSAYHPLYVGNFKAFCTLFLRSGTRIKSTDVGGDAWATDSTEIRCTCRMDCQTVDASAVKHTGFKAAGV